MTGPNYKTKINLPDKIYPIILDFIASRAVSFSSDWGKNDLNYKGGLYYTAKFNSGAVRISPRRLFGLRNRKIELSDSVDKETANMIKNIIKFNKNEPSFLLNYTLNSLQ